MDRGRRLTHFDPLMTIELHIGRKTYTHTRGNVCDYSRENNNDNDVYPVLN